VKKAGGLACGGGLRHDFVVYHAQSDARRHAPARGAAKVTDGMAKTTNSKTLPRPDLCVIGAGAAGLSVAASAALMGAQVVLIEQARMGGDCLNSGCVPSKALIAAARAAQGVREAGRFGISARAPGVDRAAVKRHVDAVIAEIAPVDSVARYRALGAEVIEGEARFVDPSTVMVGERTIKARRFVIASGAAATVPPIPGLDDVPYLTHETIFALTETPKRLAIIGGGPIGIELAQAHRRLGSDVTVFEAERILPREDVDAARLIARVLEREGVRLIEYARIRAVSGGAGAIRIDVEGEHLRKGQTFTHLLVATGRAPRVEGLGLEAAGVRYTARGIEVDQSQRSSNPRIYAIGDCAGGAQFTHAASHQAGIVIRNALFRLPAKRQDSLIPRVTFTDPEIAAVGLNEDSAQASGARGVTALRWPLAENDRARIDGATDGFAKIVTDGRGRILGVTLAGGHAGEQINLWTLAMRQKLTVSAIIDLVMPYPTYSEAARRAALNSLTPKLRSPWIGRMIRLMRVFG